MELEKLKTTISKLNTEKYFDTGKVFGTDKVVFWTKGKPGVSVITAKNSQGVEKEIDISELFTKATIPIELPCTPAEMKKFKYGAKMKTVIPENIIETSKGGGYMAYQLRYAVEFLGLDGINTFISEDRHVLKLTNDVGAVIMSLARF